MHNPLGEANVGPHAPMSRAGQRRHGVEVRAFEAVDELLRRRRNRAAAVQRDSDAEDRLALRRLASGQDVQLFSGR